MNLCLLLLFNLFLIVSAFSNTSDLQPFQNEKGEIKIAGGTAHIPVMKAAAEKIMRFNPKIRISIAGGGSGAGIKQAGERLVDIGNSGRKPTDNEINKYNLVLHKWAIDGIAIIVHPKNKVRSLTTEQAVKIFSGDISNWNALNGVDREITVYTRDESSGTRKVFWKKVLQKGPITKKANFVVSNGAMKSAIANNPYGIGFMSAGYTDKSVIAVAFDGIAPTPKNIKSGSYKVARGLYSNTKGKPGGLTEKFIRYLFTPEIQKVVKEKGFISVILDRNER